MKKQMINSAILLATVFLPELGMSTAEASDHPRFGGGRPITVPTTTTTTTTTTPVIPTRDNGLAGFITICFNSPNCGNTGTGNGNNSGNNNGNGSRVSPWIDPETSPFNPVNPDKPRVVRRTPNNPDLPTGVPVGEEDDPKSGCNFGFNRVGCVFKVGQQDYLRDVREMVDHRGDLVEKLYEVRIGGQETEVKATPSEVQMGSSLFEKVSSPSMKTCAKKQGRLYKINMECMSKNSLY